MAALPNTDSSSDTQFPEPLEFFQKDYIHPDNQALIDQEQRRWRLLGFWERIKLTRYVSRLQRQLQTKKYNQKILEFHRLGKAFYKARAEYRATTYISFDAKAEALAKLRTMVDRGHQLKGEIADLRPLYELWQHYSGWLEYEAKHRKDLRIEAKRDKRIREEMRKESKWLSKIIYDVWRQTDGCHYIYKKGTDKEKTKVPKFERCVIKPDAHWFYLRTSMRIPLLGWRYRMPHSVTPHRLQDDDVVEAMRAGAKRQCRWFWTDQNQLVLEISRLNSPDALPKNVKWRDAMTFYPQKRTARFPYTIGSKEGRHYHWLDFVSDPNVLVAGTAGSGKSNLVNGIIATLVSTHTPEELRVVLIDMKGGIEFSHWKDLPHLLWEMVKTIDEVQPVLVKLVAIMRGRMALLEATKAKDLAAYNNRVDQEQRLERIVIAIDEMNNFVGLGPLTEEIHNLIMLLVSQGRAVGVHVIACTQHPEVKVIPGRIKTNMSVRLCGWMPTISASQIVLDNPEAARLPKHPGRFIAARGMEVITVQVPEMGDDDIFGVVSSARAAFEDVSNDVRDMKDLPVVKVWNEARVIKAAVEWTEGQLSADKLHQMLGTESPGERELRKLVRSIIDQYRTAAVVQLTDDGSTWSIDRKGNRYFIRRIQLTDKSNSGDAGNSDENNVPVQAEPASELASESVPAEISAD